MKRFALFIHCLICCCVFMLASCNKDSTDPNLPVLKLHPENVTGKSGQQLTDTLDILAPYGAKTLVISKTINLVPDSSFGSVAVMPENIGTHQYRYIFTYT